ncbi:MAG: DUF2514 family protein [Betaproteobacteria bacterium]|nr:DUF2514 family protein [Betaproteobacteria bacterium]
MILLYWRFVAAALVVVMLAVTHIWTFYEGKASGKAAFDQALAEQSKKTIELERQARAKEQQLISEKQKAEVQYVQAKRQAAAAATNAHSELDRLRHELAARSASASAADPTTVTRAASRTGLESELLGHCAQALTGMAAEADRLEALVVGLQAYVKNVCLAR